MVLLLLRYLQITPLYDLHVRRIHVCMRTSHVVSCDWASRSELYYLDRQNLLQSRNPRQYMRTQPARPWPCALPVPQTTENSGKDGNASGTREVVQPEAERSSSDLRVDCVGTSPASPTCRRRQLSQPGTRPQGGLIHAAEVSWVLRSQCTPMTGGVPIVERVAQRLAGAMAGCVAAVEQSRQGNIPRLLVLPAVCCGRGGVYDECGGGRRGGGVPSPPMRVGLWAARDAPPSGMPRRGARISAAEIGRWDQKGGSPLAVAVGTPNVKLSLVALGAMRSSSGSSA